MNNLVIGQPNPKQLACMKAKTKYVCFGGARGGGKSWVVRAMAKIYALKYKGIKLLIVRRTYPELLNNHINVLIPELLEVAKYNRSEKIFNFENGSTLKFGYCSCDSDLLQYQGAEYDVLFCDEATNLTEFQLKSLTACVRGVNDFPKRVYYTCNPGGEGHQFIKRIFIDRRYNDGEKGEDYTFIQSLVTDNKVLMEAQPDYIAQLEALPPKLREAWLKGNWDIFEGVFFEEFTDNPKGYDTHVDTNVINPFKIPSNWTIYRCFDWGYNKPFACEWAAVSEDNVIYIFAEYYGCTETPNEGVKMPPENVFDEIKRIESEHPFLKGKRIIGVADPAIFNSQTGKSIAETAAERGVYFYAGDNRRIPGWLQMHYRLMPDKNGRSMMYVFKNCKGFIRTIPTLVYDQHKPEDLDTKGEDHIADAVRYLCMSRLIKPAPKKKRENYADNPLFYAFDIPEGELAPPPTKEAKITVKEVF